MGFWDGLDSASVISRKSSHSRGHRSSSSLHKSKKSRSRSPTRHFKHHHRNSSGLDSIWEAESRASSPRSPRDSAASFFNLGNSSSRSFFSTGRSNNSSFYRRSPRSSFLQRTYKKLKRLLRDLVYYAKRHPLKVFVLVVMPLVTGGALTALLARFGLRLPPGVERMLGVAARTASGDGGLGLVGEAMRIVSDVSSGGGGSGGAGIRVERGRGDGVRWERRTEYTDGEDWSGGILEALNKFFS
ncbi:hypothetical protein F5X96DRAFT_442161 [Biscogniauxia mediterranea]|nr:hypothetical protein F5X96DRAFT_442161 [Biscogniauxia mediterranea]